MERTFITVVAEEDRAVLLFGLVPEDLQGQNLHCFWAKGSEATILATAPEEVVQWAVTVAFGGPRLLDLPTEEEAQDLQLRFDDLVALVVENLPSS